MKLYGMEVTIKFEESIKNVLYDIIPEYYRMTFGTEELVFDFDKLSVKSKDENVIKYNVSKINECYTDEKWKNIDVESIKSVDEILFEETDSMNNKPLKVLSIKFYNERGKTFIVPKELLEDVELRIL